MSGRVLALALMAIVVVAAQPIAAAPRPSSGRPPSVHQQLTGVVGDDACGLLSDDEILAATGATGVVGRTPGPQSMLSAGCYWQLEGTDTDLYGPWELFLGIQPQGGRQRYEDEVAFFEVQPIAGLGDKAAELFGTFVAVKGDTYVNLQYLAFGGPPRSPTLSARALMWLIMKRLRPDETAVASSPTPSAVPLSAARALVERVRAEPFGDDNIAAVIEILARSGIATYETPMSPTPIQAVEGVESPLALLWDQVRAMALEAWSSGGLAGEDLDGLVAVDPDLAPPSYLLAGYVATAETEGAEVARALMGERDWAEAPSLVFPQLVLALFSSDLARDRMAEAGVTTQRRVTRAAAMAVTGEIRTAQGGACTAASDFISGALSRVFQALRLGEGGGGSIFRGIWNFVVSVLETVVTAIVRQFEERVLNLIGQVAGTVAVVTTIVNAIRPWTVTVGVVPPLTHKGVGAIPPESGRVRVRVELAGLSDWPAFVKDCAQRAGRALPDLRPEGAPVRWQLLEQTPGDLVAETGRTTVLDAQGAATLDFTTLVDAVPEPWETRLGFVRSRVTIERPDLRNLANVGIDFLLAQLPSQVQPVIRQFIQGPIDQLKAKLDSLISTQVSDMGYVVYHTPAATPEPDATPRPTAPPQEVWVHVERPAGDGIAETTVIELYSCSGPYGAWSGVVRLGGVGPVPIAEFPVAFEFRGASGVQRAAAAVDGLMPWVLPDVAYDVHIDLDSIVDGKTMTLAITTQLDEQVQGGSLLSGQGIEAVSKPIEVAPPGSC